MTTMLFEVRGGREMKVRCECCREVLALDEEVCCAECTRQAEQSIWGEEE